jgi:hypothetical protein
MWELPNYGTLVTSDSSSESSISLPSSDDSSTCSDRWPLLGPVDDLEREENHQHKLPCQSYIPRFRPRRGVLSHPRDAYLPTTTDNAVPWTTFATSRRVVGVVGLGMRFGVRGAVVGFRLCAVDWGERQDSRRCWRRQLVGASMGVWQRCFEMANCRIYAFSPRY